MCPSPPDNKANPQDVPDDYELKIDDQVNKFLDLNHKLTFFLVTAAVGTLGFTLNFTVASKVQLASNLGSLVLIGFAAVLALLSAGIALFALNADIKSFRLHLKYRYKRKSFENLTDQEQNDWVGINRLAASSRRWAFIFLVATATLQVGFFMVTFTEKGEPTVHHYGEDFTKVIATATGFDIVFTNRITGQVITMHIPRGETKSFRGAKELTLQETQILANNLAHVLRQQLK
jgi:hypothetical protein